MNGYGQDDTNIKWQQKKKLMSMSIVGRSKYVLPHKMP